MSLAQAIPYHLRPRREKVFGDGRPRPLDRNAKARIMTRARALTHRTEKGKHYGQLTAKYLDVLEALLLGFGGASGLCFPGYARIAEKARCAASTVGEAIKALEDAGLLSWVNRIKRKAEAFKDMFGQFSTRERVVRTSNLYSFHDPNPAAAANSSKAEIPAGPNNQVCSSPSVSAPPTLLDPNNPVEARPGALGRGCGQEKKRSAASRAPFCMR